MPAFTQCIHFQFSFFFLQFEFALLCFCFVLFCFVVLLIFQADTSSILFHLVVENLILHIFLIIMIIIPCFGMFRNVPGCSGMFHVPGFIDAHLEIRATLVNAVYIGCKNALDMIWADHLNRFDLKRMRPA